MPRSPKAIPEPARSIQLVAFNPQQVQIVLFIEGDCRMGLLAVSAGGGWRVILAPFQVLVIAADPYVGVTAPEIVPGYNEIADLVACGCRIVVRLSIAFFTVYFFVRTETLTGVGT